MKNRINLDDPDYEETNSSRIIIQDSNVNLWVVLGSIAVITIMIMIAIAMQ